MLGRQAPVQGEAVALSEGAGLRVDDRAARDQLVVVEHVEVVGAAAVGAVRRGAQLEGDAVVEASGRAGVGFMADVRSDTPHRSSCKNTLFIENSR